MVHHTRSPKSRLGNLEVFIHERVPTLLAASTHCKTVDKWPMLVCSNGVSNR